MVIADVDEMEGADADIARATSLRGSDVTMATVDGGHFGLITVGTEHFARSLAAHEDFVRRHLLEETA
jgi:hypothetical protein